MQADFVFLFWVILFLHRCHPELLGHLRTFNGFRYTGGQVVDDYRRQLTQRQLLQAQQPARSSIKRTPSSAPRNVSFNDADANQAARAARKLPRKFRAAAYKALFVNILKRGQQDMQAEARTPAAGSKCSMEPSPSAPSTRPSSATSIQSSQASSTVEYATKLARIATRKHPGAKVHPLSAEPSPEASPAPSLAPAAAAGQATPPDVARPERTVPMLQDKACQTPPRSPARSEAGDVPCLSHLVSPAALLAALPAQRALFADGARLSETGGSMRSAHDALLTAPGP